MKKRLNAILLAAGLSVSALTFSAYAEETTTEAITEEAAEVSAEAAAGTTTATVEGGTYAQYYDQMKEASVSLLQQLSAMSDAQLDEYINGTDEAAMIMCATWKSYKDELGSFVSAGETTVEEDGTDVIVTMNDVVYDGVSDNVKTTVTCTFDMKNSKQSLDWNIQYPMSKLIGEAALNTLLGLGTVFIVLLFLAFVIGNIHWIPDIIEGTKKKKEAANAPAAPVAAPAPVVEEEEELVDDSELVAVIAAAIAAAEQTSTDGFVVRSIKKANRRNWLNA